VNVLMWLSSHSRDVLGGHQVQMDETAQALRERGHEVEVVEGDQPDVHAGYDIVHGLGLMPHQVRLARQASLPVVISTIWWPLRYIAGRDMPWSVGRALAEVRRVGGALRRAVRDDGSDSRGPYARTALSFESAAVLLPNGPGEAAATRADLGVSTPMMTVPNGVRSDRFVPGKQAREDFLLLVGRIEPHKNQLGAIEALRGTGRPILVAGPPHPHHPV
jgi:glycosyltransferase involved in cell wall biosynthesis